MALKCHASVLARSVSCVPDTELSGLSNLTSVKEPSFGSVKEWTPVGPVATPGEAILIGHQHVNVSVITKDVAFASDSFTFNTAVANRSPAPIGTVDGVTADTSLAIFFHSGPTATGGGPPITVANPSGFGTFTASNQPFYSYAEILHKDDTSAYKLWKLHVPSGVTLFNFFLLVHASVEHPDGFVKVLPPLDSIEVGATIQLVDSVKNALGWPATDGGTTTWSSNTDSVASVNSSTGLVTGNSPGTATITATNGPRTGQATIVVTPPASTPEKLGIATQPYDSVQSGVAFPVQPRIQLLDAADNPIAQAGVEITAAIASGGGTLGGDVTKSTDSAGIAAFTDLMITGTVGNRTLSFKATGLDSVVSNAVHVRAGVPDSLAVVDASNSASSGGTVGVTASVLDGSSNPVGGVTVNWTQTSTGVAGSFSPSASSLTNASGVASVTFTVATAPGTQHRVIGTIAGPIVDTTGTIIVTGPPSAVNDSSTSTSAPGDVFHTAFNTQFTGSLTANDNLGSPAATVTHFGGDSLGSSVTDFTAGSTANVNGHSVTVGSNGAVTFTPRTGFTGYFRFFYRIANTVGSSDAEVRIAVGVRPNSSNSTYPHTLLGNVPMATNISTQTKVNATGDALVYHYVQGINGGRSLHTDGTYGFLGNVGFTGTGRIVFNVSNGFGASTNDTVTFNITGLRVWHVHPSAGGSGQWGQPMGCVAGAGTCLSTVGLAAGDIIYIAAGTYNSTGSLTLPNNVRVIGQGASGSFADAANANVTWPADAGDQPGTAGTRPTLNPSGSSVFTLGSGNTIRGLISGSATGASITGSAVGTFTMGSAAIINTTGRAIDLTTSGTLAVALDSIIATGGTGNGINLVSQTGTLTSGITKITNPSVTGIHVQSSGGFSFRTTTVNKGSTAGTGVNLNTNTGTTSFGSLAIRTNSGTALFTSSAGTVNVGGGSLSATGGPAIDATRATFSGAGFMSTSSSGSPGRGVSLTSVTGTLALGAGSIGTAATEDFFVSGGDGTISYAGSITNWPTARFPSLAGLEEQWHCPDRSATQMVQIFWLRTEVVGQFS